MADDKQFPKSLLEATRYFADPDVCVDFMASMRWPDGVTCPHCQGKRVSYLSSRRIWKCMNKDCHKQFSVKTGSVFEDSAIPLDKWLTAVWLVVNCKNGISSYEIARDLRITQKSAWFMLHRIRVAMQDGSKGYVKMGGPGQEVESDEAFIGGKPRNMHLSKRNALKRAKNAANTVGDTRMLNKTAVLGMFDREQRQIRTQILSTVTRQAIQAELLKNVAHGSKVYTDESNVYSRLPKEYVHAFVNHVERYVDGRVHTNCLENFWSLLKRGLGGTYVAVEPFHLHRYLDEQVFRFNNRRTKDNPLNDADRFALAVSQISGKRLTYAELTGKDQQSQPF